MKIDEKTQNKVKAAYGKVASSGFEKQTDLRSSSIQIGYTQQQLEDLPKNADLGLGCGNPIALASITDGDVVLDLGSGGGIDAFLAADKVGELGRVIGIDLTPEMLRSARDSASQAGLSGRVEFREGNIENLPVVSESIDVILSNCVINLSANKLQAFSEAFRVLKPGGRLSVSDLCLTKVLPQTIVNSASSVLGCVGDASLFEDYISMMREVGFKDIEWTSKSAKPLFEAFSEDPIFAELRDSVGPDVIEAATESVFSYQINARRPHD